MAMSKKRTQLKSKTKAKHKPRGTTKARGRQFYSEIGQLKSSTKKTAKKKTARKAAPTRELLAEISKVGKSLKRRVKRAL